MKHIIAIIILAASVATAELVMRYDGKTATGPRTLPRTAQRLLDGSGTVSNLRGADWPTRNACGFYEAVKATADEGMVATAKAWPVKPDKGVFRQTITTQITQAIYDAQQTATVQAEHDAQAPGVDLSTWSKRERCLLLVCYKLAQEHWPTMTKKQFLNNVQAEWDVVK